MLDVYLISVWLAGLKFPGLKFPGLQARISLEVSSQLVKISQFSQHLCSAPRTVGRLDPCQ